MSLERDLGVSIEEEEEEEEVEGCSGQLSWCRWQFLVAIETMLHGSLLQHLQRHGAGIHWMGQREGWLIFGDKI
ncbi:hypothetical protein chiPu_0004315 [Chiloscyllium punctatum]|uniref:Uncharacterized protein n=1 Tax=Chiloscyllium punctatum TaxID=137246 RepID=A0A401S687_CHIPU|nr:hypothetical protein [Chiloscyllium punctatum]